MKASIVVGLGCLLLPLQVFATDIQVAICKRDHFNLSFGPLATAQGDHTITSIWLDGGANDKKFGLGHVMKRSPNGDLMLLISEPSKDKPGPGSIIIYTAGLHQAVVVSNPDPEAETSVAIADCTVKNVPSSKP